MEVNRICLRIQGQLAHICGVGDVHVCAFLSRAKRHHSPLHKNISLNILTPLKNGKTIIEGVIKVLAGQVQL